MARVRWPSRRVVFAALSVIGLINCVLLLRPFGQEGIEPVPISAAIAPAKSESPLGLRAYVSFAKTRTVAAKDRDMIHASIMFISYFLMSTRGMGEHCDRTSTDLGPAKATFANVHQTEYEKASGFLASHGINSDILWQLFKTDLTNLASIHLDQYAARYSQTRAGTCQRLADDPESFAAGRFYRTNYPALHAVLMR